MPVRLGSVLLPLLFFPVLHEHRAERFEGLQSLASTNNAARPILVLVVFLRGGVSVT